MNNNNKTSALSKLMESALADQVPRVARFALLKDQGVSDRKARTLAGYSQSTVPHRLKTSQKYKKYKEQIKERRAELSAKRGYSLEDSARFYRLMSEATEAAKLRKEALALLRDSESEDAIDRARTMLEEAERLEPTDAARIRARERLDKLLGYDSPLEVEHGNESQDERPVVQLINILSDMRVSPQQLKAELDEIPEAVLDERSDSKQVPAGEETGAQDEGSTPDREQPTEPEGCRPESKGGGGGPDVLPGSLIEDPFPEPNAQDFQDSELLLIQCSECNYQIGTNEYCGVCEEYKSKKNREDASL